MLTEDEARRLLHQAGQTVPVDSAAPIIDEPGRRRVWPILAAAAAVIVLAVTAVLIAAPGTHEDPPPTPPVTHEVQIPSVLGFDLNSATDALRELGLSVRVETEPACNTDYVRGTIPPAGTPIEPGAEVVVRHLIPGQGFCISEEEVAVNLLALADGRGSGPRLTDDVEVYDATGATNLDSVLDRLSAAAHAFYPGSNTDEYLSPRLVWDPPLGCRYTGGPTLAGREFVRVGVVASVSATACPAFVIDVYRTRDAIDALVPRELGDVVESENTGTMVSTAKAFRNFARVGDLMRFADHVDLYLGNAFTGFVTETSARDRAVWATCTEVGSYAARSCPLSPLEVLEQHREVDYTDRPQGLCMPTYGPIPAELRSLDRVTIVPAEGSISSCIQNFAVQLFANSDGELVAVSLLLGEP